MGKLWGLVPLAANPKEPRNTSLATPAQERWSGSVLVMVKGYPDETIQWTAVPRGRPGARFSSGSRRRHGSRLPDRRRVYTPVLPAAGRQGGHGCDRLQAVRPGLAAAGL